MKPMNEGQIYRMEEFNNGTVKFTAVEQSENIGELDPDTITDELINEHTDENGHVGAKPVECIQCLSIEEAREYIGEKDKFYFFDYINVVAGPYRINGVRIGKKRKFKAMDGWFKWVTDSDPYGKRVYDSDGNVIIAAEDWEC